MAIKRNVENKINEELVDRLSLLFTRDYKTELDRIQKDVIRGRSPTVIKVKEKKIDEFVRIAYFASLVLLADKFPKKKEYLAINKLPLGSPNNTKKFVSNIVKFSVDAKFDAITKPPDEISKRLAKNFQTEVTRINKQITTNTSKAIIKRKQALRRKRIEVNGVKRPMTDEEIANQLRKEYADNNARVERIVRTETHRQNEAVKQVVAIEEGFTHKTWVTEKDSAVRHSHAALNGKKIPIKSQFNVGGHKAMYPSDPSLPPDESINCRCNLIYS